VINPAVDDLAELTSTKQACELLGRPRGSRYRAKQPRMHGPRLARPTPRTHSPSTSRQACSRS
jgi:putative transposase